MATTIGTGVIVLLVIWVVSILIMLLFTSAQGKIRFVALVPAVLSGIVTIVLVSLPRGSTTATAAMPDYMFSYTPLIWIFIFTALVLTLVACLMVYFVTDIMEARYAHVDKSPRLIR